MTNTVTPTWTDNITVVTAQVLTLGSNVSAVWNLSAKISGVLFVAIGRGGTTALTTSGPIVEVRRMINGATITHPAPQASSRIGGTTAANSTTVGTTSNSGQNVLTVS